jgi:hypothetical protein
MFKIQATVTTIINYNRNTFVVQGQSYKTFYARNLRIFVIS